MDYLIGCSFKRITSRVLSTSNNTNWLHITSISSHTCKASTSGCEERENEDSDLQHSKLSQWRITKMICSSTKLCVDVISGPGQSQGLLYNHFHHWLSDWSFSSNIVIPKPEELGSWNIERMFIPHYVSCVRCNFFCIPKKIWRWWS